MAPKYLNSQSSSTANLYPFVGSSSAPLSSANTMTAASSRLDIDESPDASPNASSASSQKDCEMPEQLCPKSSDTPLTHSPRVRRSWMNASLSLRHIDMIVLVTCFITGLTDIAMFANYATFVSMQTGNTIFIALGASQQNTNGFIWIRSIFSLFSYCLGSFLFARLHDKILGPKTRRITVLLSYTIQAILIIISAGIISTGIVGRYSPGIIKAPHEQWDSLAPICLLSLGAGGQIVSARSLGVPEVPTVVVTSMLCELWSDPALFRKHNPGRNRRAAGFLLMLIGAIAGGWIDKVSRTTQAALWLAAGLKMSCVVALAFWKGDVGEEEGEKRDIV